MSGNIAVSFVRNTLFGFMAVISCLLLSACSEPSSDETYVRTDQCDKYGRYVFPVAMTDSLQRYDVDLFCIFDCSDVEFSSFVEMPVHMLWMSPSDIPYEEQVILERQSLADRTSYSKRFYTPYREGIKPKETGDWTLCVSIPDDYKNAYKINVIGIKLTRNSYGAQKTEKI